MKLAFLLCAAMAASAAATSFGPVELTTDARLDSVTVGQRFHVAYRFSFPDSLKQVIPDHLNAGTCRVMSIAWSEQHKEKQIERTADVTFIPVDLDSSVVPANRFAFISPAGDTLIATSDSIEVPIRRIAAGAKDTRPLKEQWSLPPNYLLWALVGLGAAALIAALVWWIRRRRARRAALEPPAPKLPPDFVALTELERIAGMGLIERGEFKPYYTLVVDVIRRYLEARYGIEAMDRTTTELVSEISRRDVRVDDLAVLLGEADLVKFAKLVPTRDAALVEIERARNIIVATTPKAPIAPEPTAQAAAAGSGTGA